MVANLPGLRVALTLGGAVHLVAAAVVGVWLTAPAFATRRRGQAAAS